MIEVVERLNETINAIEQMEQHGNLNVTSVIEALTESLSDINEPVISKISNDEYLPD